MSRGIKMSLNTTHILRHTYVRWTKAHSMLRHIHTVGTDTEIPQIDISPRRCLVDDVWSLRVKNLKPSHPVTLVSRVVENEARFFAHAHYVTNGAGHVDVKHMAAHNGGSYTGIEPMGLIWSQTQEPGQEPGERLTKSDVTTPIVTHVYALDGFVNGGDSLRQIENGSWLAYNTCDRLYMADGVERIIISQGRLEGTLFVPDGVGPFPGVLDIFGVIPRALEHRSALLASRGVASMALSYTENLKIPEDLEYFEAAVDYLLLHPKVQKPHVGAVGVSKGAEFVLLMGALFTDKMKACISINGSIVPTSKSHTYKGEHFPCMPVPPNNEIERTEDGAMKILTSFQKYADIDGFFEQNAIPLERSNCEFLLICGEDDHAFPPYMTELMGERLEHHGKTCYGILRYPGAGHLLEPPYSPLFTRTYHPVPGILFDWGGQCHQHAKAQEHSWQRIVDFFKTTLGKQTK